MANATLNPTDLSSMTAPVPAAPVTVADTGIPADRLTQLLLKTLYTGEATGTQASERMCLAFSVIAPLLEAARVQMLIEVLGTTSASSGAAGYRYALTDLGRDRARAYLDANNYVGPAPVPLEAYVAQIMGVRTARGYIDRERLRAGFSHLIIADELLEQLGPAVNAGKGLFLYGPPGNGKSVIAEGLGRSLGGDLYVPYAIDIDGQIVTVFDPVNHETLEPAAQEQGAIVRTAPRDHRWVRIRRPVIIVGGELTLDMLDLSFNPIAKFHEAPLQMKANGGVFLVDDFGRQRMRPEDLLNRWIVPLESRVDYLTLHTGRKFHVPFEVLIVFATNLDPLSLADEAFLRRIPYKIPIGDPTMDQFTEIFELNCKRKGLRFHQVMVAYLIRRHYTPINRPLRACQPRDVIEQVIALSRYRGHEPVITREMIDAACRAYFVEGELESGGIARTTGSGVKRSSGSLEVH